MAAAEEETGGAPAAACPPPLPAGPAAPGKRLLFWIWKAVEEEEAVVVAVVAAAVTVVEVRCSGVQHNVGPLGLTVTVGFMMRGVTVVSPLSTDATLVPNPPTAHHPTATVTISIPPLSA